MAKMPIPNDWDGETWNCWAIEWPNSQQWTAMLSGFVSQGIKGRFWDERTGSVTDAQDIGYEIYYRNSPLRGSIMACNDESLAVLNGILEVLQALVDKPCCPTGTATGSRGSGSTGRPPNPYNQDETPTEPPPGFDDMTQFNSHKCNSAEDILNDLANDLIGLSGITYSGQSPTGLIGALVVILLTPIPYDDLIALAAYLIYSAYSYTFLAEMAAQIDANKTDLRCTLYNSSDSATAQTNLLSDLETIALDTFTTTDDAQWVMGAIEYMLPYDATNKLFEDIPTVSQNADCSACEPGDLLAIQNDACTPPHDFGTIVSGDLLNGTVRMESTNVPWLTCGATDMVARVGLGRVSPTATFQFTWTKHAPGSNVTVQYLDENGDLQTTDTDNAPNPITGRTILFQSIGLNHPVGYLDFTIAYAEV